MWFVLKVWPVLFINLRFFIFFWLHKKFSFIFAIKSKITIKSTKPEDASALIKDIDFSFKLGKDYDGIKSEAKFNNGLLSIIIDKKDERKAKKLSINIR